MRANQNRCFCQKWPNYFPVNISWLQCIRGSERLLCGSYTTTRHIQVYTASKVAQIHLPMQANPTRLAYESVDGMAITGGDMVIGETDSTGKLTRAEDPIIADTKGKITAKGLMWGTRGLWPDGIIPYNIVKEDFSELQLQKINFAIEHYNRKTLVDFVQYDKDIHNSVVTIRKPDISKCSASLGYHSPEFNHYVNLSDLCLRGHSPENIQSGLVIHELGHVVGLLHEHTRPDRDYYVAIYWDKIQDRYKSRYCAYGRPPTEIEVDNRCSDMDISDYIMTTPYDLDSVMHYSGVFQGSYPGQIIMEPHNPDEDITDNYLLSDYDIESINDMYGLLLDIPEDQRCKYIDGGADCRLSSTVYNCDIPGHPDVCQIRKSLTAGILERYIQDHSF